TEAPTTTPTTQQRSVTKTTQPRRAFTGGPRSFSLAVSGTVAGGAQVITTVANSLDVGLAVIPADANLAAPVALVPLGHVQPGGHTLPWDLRAGGQPLAAGRYVVALEIFDSGGHPSGRAFPPPALLTVTPDGHTSAEMTPISSTSSAPTTRTKSNWAIVGIGALIALAIGLLAGRFSGRRRTATA
ncbi:MAG: hypothetical protein ACYDAD_15690, partial [Acidimicrobiales bacterium]